MKLQKLITIIILITTSSGLLGQNYANKTESDTISEYNNLLPFMGKKVHALGFDLPYAGGLSINYLNQEADLVINNVNVGFNNGTMYDVDQLIRFNTTVAHTQGVNIRPDIWVLPFLNIYGIFAVSKTSTEVDVSIFIPRVNGVEELFRIKTQPEFNAVTTGFGFTPTAGIWGAWMAFDMNFTWTDNDALDKPVYAFVFDPRIGKTFTFRNPEQNISLWVGGFRLAISNDTNGSLFVNEIFDTEEWGSNVEIGKVKVTDAQIELDSWWGDLTQIEQRNPINIAKYQTNNKKLEIAGNVLGAAGNVVDFTEGSSIQYSLDKKQKSMWNFIVGTQFQINKSWMIRAEYGFLSNRTHLIASLQYRFKI